MQEVLLTGITGFLGSHTAIQLLNLGYKVTGTLRNMERADSIKNVIAEYTDHIANLNLAQADLMDEKAWSSLSKGKNFIIHVASPFPRELPTNEAELIDPAKDGTLHVLKAAKLNHVKRIVIVSSLAAIVYGKTKERINDIFTENNWTDEDNIADTAPYIRSKTIAEKAAWEYVSKEGSGLELVTVLPGAILGPVLEEDYGTSANIIIKMLAGNMPALPKIGFDIIDVRSVADLLTKALVDPSAAGNRYIASSGYASMRDIAIILKEKYQDRKISTSQLPNLLARLFSNFEPTLKPILLDLGIKRKVDIRKAYDNLNWKPYSTKEAILSCAKSVLDLKIVK
ncbi:NAD-dependent epimerase/dehydratase family protein [Sphingobacterium shayense]|uniref:NAD-dependent epimerase/dehydratase family protein n=1 Tax=Sphingobacterium shayense TaxID=626343 RepID=UPI00155298C3|nr:NAD-dependent epimerase/dehydratase family protein [Sphingobacterium shayense]NQD69286.1 NAD-dependent epimerase/dehydratase family protein [Sphingobacterium shayense]